MGPWPRLIDYFFDACRCKKLNSLLLAQRTQRISDGKAKNSAAGAVKCSPRNEPPDLPPWHVGPYLTVC